MKKNIYAPIANYQTVEMHGWDSNLRHYGRGACVQAVSHSAREDMTAECSLLSVFCFVLQCNVSIVYESPNNYNGNYHCLIITQLWKRHAERCMRLALGYHSGNPRHRSRNYVTHSALMSQGSGWPSA